MSPFWTQFLVTFLMALAAFLGWRYGRRLIDRMQWDDETGQALANVTDPCDCPDHLTITPLTLDEVLWDKQVTQ